MNRPLIFALLSVLLTACASAPEKTQKTSDIHYGYGTEELMQQNYTQAISHLLKAVELEPKNAEIHNNLGMAYYFKGEKELARQHVQRALELDPKNTDALSNLASLSFEEGDMQTAERLYVRALKDLTYEKHARTYYNLALIEMRRNNPEKALAFLNNSVKENDSYCPAWLQKGIVDYRARRFEEASRNFIKARMGACANQPAPLYWLGTTEIELGDYFTARTRFNELVNKFSDSPFANMAQRKLTELTLLESNEQGSLIHSSQKNDTQSTF